MKKGAGDDPFADEPELEPETEEEDAVETVETASSRGDEQANGAVTTVESSSPSVGDDLPYLARRQLKDKSVKADRDQVPFFLRQQVQQGERELRRAVEDDLGQEVGKTDLREAAYVYAQRNPEGVADILREWGVEYLE